jgi:phage tail-like protein
MSTEYLAPGVYIEEVPFESHPIEGVSTGGPCDRLVLPGKAWTELGKMAVNIGKRCPRCRALVIGADPGARLFALRALALELRLSLYRIDLSEVVSKYVGETEKNLGRLFKAAEAAEMILFFDEADALFGKRSEIKDAHERYANHKLGTLAQRIENCAGVVILGVNHDGALDCPPGLNFEFIVSIDRNPERRMAPHEKGKRQTSKAMAGKRPYMQFNFLLNLGVGNKDEPHAGFQECTNIGIESPPTDYRDGNKREKRVRKITGLNKSTDVTLKRGVIGSSSLFQWLNDIRNGNRSALRTVTIQLQNEGHTDVVQTWKLKRARIIKHVSGPLNAKGTDVAMEELTLSYERLEME